MKLTPSSMIHNLVNRLTFLVVLVLLLPRLSFAFTNYFGPGYNERLRYDYNPSNTAQAIGKFIGQVGTSFVPGIGQAADIRDLSAAFNAGRTEGWNIRTSVGVAMAGLAFVPLIGDVAKAGVKPLFGKPATTVMRMPNVTGKGIVRIEQHLSRPGLEDAFGRSALQDPANARMLERLRSGLRTDHDIAFYMHELKESALMNRGIAPRPAHLQTLKWQNIPYVRGYEKRLYSPDAIDLFNSGL